MQIAVRAREVVDLQPLDLLARWPPAWSAASAPRRACADARERRRAAPGRAAASRRSRSVTARLTSATAASIGRDRTEHRRAGASHDRAEPDAVQERAAATASRTDGDDGDGGRIAADAERPVQPRRARCAAAGGSRSPPRRRGVRRQAGDSRDRADARPPRRHRSLRRALRAARTALRAMSSSVRLEPRASSSMALR